MKIRILLILALFFLFFSCKKDDTKRPKDYKSNKPQNNDLLVDDVVVGNSQFINYFIMLNEQNGQNFYFGVFEEQAVHGTTAQNYDVVIGGNESIFNDYFEYDAGLVSISGNQIKVLKPGFQIRNILELNTENQDFDGGLVVLGNYIDPVTNSIKGRLVVYDKLLNNYISVSSQNHYWFNEVVIKSYDNTSVTFVIVGGAKTSSDKTYPCIFEVKIIFSEGGNVINQKIFYNYEEKWFMSINISNNIYYCSISSSYDIGKGMMCIDQNFSEIWAFENMYLLDYYYYTPLGGTNIYQNKLLISGWGSDPHKGTDANDGYWKSGLITCVDLDSGNDIWQSKIVLTNFTERILGSVVYNGYLYVCGIYGNYINSKSKESSENWVYGNAFVSKIDINNGKVLATGTFGKEGCCSGFNGISVVNNVICLAGWTNKLDDTHGYNAWYVTIPIF